MYHISKARVGSQSYSKLQVLTNCMYCIVQCVSHSQSIHYYHYCGTVNWIPYMQCACNLNCPHVVVTTALHLYT